MDTEDKCSQVNAQIYADVFSAPGEQHRYDGVAYPESIKEGTFKSLGKGALRTLGLGIQTLTEKIRVESVASGKEFLPAPEDVQQAVLNQAGCGQRCTAEDLLNRVHTVMSTLRLQILDSKLEKPDHDLANMVNITINVCCAVSVYLSLVIIMPMFFQALDMKTT